MFTRFIIPIFFFFLNNSLSAGNLSHVDSLSIKIPAESAGSMDELVAYCENHVWNDYQRVRFYFVWVATHIQYDEDAVGQTSQNPETVFKSKKALCSGYSRLLAHLCEKSGVQARYVAGYGKEPNDSANIQNHAWNVIRISDKWYLFDVTWAVNELSEERENMLTPAFENWFFSVPEIFHKTHLPFDPMYQLSNQLVKRSDFFSKPNTQLIYTEGDTLKNSETCFSEILDEEATLDSLEQSWRSLRRGYNYMPMDSAVAIKLAKTQDAKVKRTFELIQQFCQKDYPNICLSPTETLKNGLSKLQRLEKPIEEALDCHAELETFPLSEDNKRAVKQNHQLYQTLVDFAKKSIKELNAEITSRE